MGNITLKDLVNMFNELPNDILNKQIDYLDLAHMDKDDLENLRTNLLILKDKENIALCQN